MYLVGELKDKNRADEIQKLLLAQGLHSHIRIGDEVVAHPSPGLPVRIYSLWVEAEEDAIKGQMIFAHAMGFKTTSIDPEEQAMRSQLARLSWPPVTKFIFILSIAIFVFSLLIENSSMETFLSFLGFSLKNETVLFSSIKNGEFYRLFTPIFLHFGFLHLIFNVMWLKDLGKIHEHFLGSRVFLLMCLLIGSVSNILQYLWTGPSFGGLSGILYGLIGMHYALQWGQVELPVKLPRHILVMMLVWYAVCLFPSALIPIANLAHGAGVSMGIILAGGLIIKENGNRQRALWCILLGAIPLLLTGLVEYQKLNGDIYFAKF